MTKGIKIFNSLIAMRRIVAKEIYNIESTRHTHVVDDSSIDKLLLMWEGICILLKNTLTADIESSATFKIDIPVSFAGGAITVNIEGNDVATGVATNLGSSLGATLETQIEAYYSGQTSTPVTVTHSYSGTETTVTVSGPALFNGADVSLSATGTTEAHQVIFSDISDFSGGYEAGEIKPSFDYSVAQELYDKLVSYFEKSGCCEEIFYLQNLHSKVCAPTLGVGVFGPVAAFSATPDVAGNLTTFDGSASINNEGGATSDLIFLWNYGDGNTTGPSTGVVNTSHVYTSAGTYTACLAVTHPDGAEANKVCLQIIIPGTPNGIGYMGIETDFIVG